jgi:phage gpG-like protein
MESFTSNASHLSEQLERFAARVGDPLPALERLRALLAGGEQEVWSTQGMSIGFHWASPVEADRKTDPTLLVATGALRSSLTGEGAGEPASAVELRFGTDVPYGRFHQFGTRKMTARQFMGLSPDIDTAATDLLAIMIDEAQ